MSANIRVYIYFIHVYSVDMYGYVNSDIWSTLILWAFQVSCPDPSAHIWVAPWRMQQEE